MYGAMENLVLVHVISWTVLLTQLLFTTSLATTTLQSLADGPMRCYACTSTSESSPCETDPATLPHGILDTCARDACTIVRVEEWPSQRVKSFYRGCDGRTKVFERNNCQIEKDERTCFTACVGDLCNLGDGLVADNIVHSASIPAGSGWAFIATTAAAVVTFSTILLSAL
ncbi:uncharacterized protein LOC130693004 [Daphnia carinata]|uniref:uncharacterized protein LOC130693004 n=1 Tax=Daphnia carinata TaxID=120202 RepID=UPI00257F6111|nr:uncharacterized protein LOC130693004 [Daphnia carinata]